MKNLDSLPKWIAVLTSILLLIGLCVGWANAAPAPTVAPPEWNKTLIFSCPVMLQQAHSETGWADNFYLKEVEKRTGGRLKFRKFWGGTLCKDEEFQPALSKGKVAQMGGLSINKQYSANPHWSLLTQSYLWGNNFVEWDFVHEVLLKNPVLVKELAALNIKLLQCFVSGPKGVVSPRSVLKPSDMKGMKVRTIGPVDAKIISSFGGIPVTMPFAEVPESLSRGVIDAVFPVVNHVLYTLGFAKFAPYYIDFVGGSDPVVPYIGINLDVWNSLPQDIQKIMLETADYCTAQSKADHKNSWKESIKKARETGAFVHIPSEEELRVWKDAIDPTLYKAIDEIGTKLGVKDPVGFVKGIMKEYAEFQKTHKE